MESPSKREQALEDLLDKNRGVLNTYRWMFRRVLEELVTAKLCTRMDGKFNTDKALRFRFRLRFEKGQPSRIFEILVYAPTNYVGVFSRTAADSKPYDSELNQNAGWVLRGYHDSCWRESLERAIFEMDDHFYGFDWDPWTDLILKVEEQEFLRGLIRKSRAH